MRVKFMFPNRMNRELIRTATKDWNEGRPEQYGNVTRKYSEFGVLIEAPVPSEDVPDPALDGLVDAISNHLGIDNPEYEIIE